MLNKLMAVYGGPGALTLLAHFQNLLAMFTALPAEGVHVGVVKYLAPLRSSSGRYQAWLGAGIVLNLGALLLGFGALLGAPKLLLGAFDASLIWMALFVVGMILLIAQAFLTAVLLAAGQLQAYVRLTVALSGLGVGAAAVMLVSGRGAEQALVAYLLGQGLVALPAFWMAQWHGLLPRLHGKISRTAVRQLGQFLLMAVSVLLFSYAVNFELRSVLIRRFPIAQVDLWQAVAKLSDNYTMVFSALMSSVYYPRLAALIGRPDVLRTYVRTLVLLVAVLAALGLGFLFLLRKWLLVLLFDAHFAAARDLLWPQLLGDWAKFLTWMLLFLLMAQARVGRYVAVQAVSAAMYAGLLAVLLPRYGLLGAPLAHAARFGLLLLGCSVYFRNYLRR
ncbi:LPS biosynthesis protein [Hymenobacter cavernae]|uniref:LPS biosynthesis protein n=1 Tax=Hymenobacter cavernae TaxID=2044852 RepID=A0ABQ1U4C1_9BACT|nr:LPS biosynthesis protein [Hymenobacter cavernae]